MEPGDGLVTLVAEGAEPSSQDRTPGACSDGGRLSDADVEQRNMVKFAFETAAVDEGGAGQTPEERTENYLVVKAQRQRDQRARAAARAYFAAQADQRASASGGVGARQAVVEVVSRQQRIRKLYREQRIRQKTAPKASSGRTLSRKVRVPPAQTTTERKKEEEDKARSLFEAFDANGDGLLDLGEFVAYLTVHFFAWRKGECEREYGKKLWLCFNTQHGGVPRGVLFAKLSGY